jgi:hypothetical protein
VSRPEKGTPEYDLWVTAIDIAIRAPYDQNPTTVDTKIPWLLIHELRSRLDALDINWRAAKTKNDDELAHSRREVTAARAEANRRRNEEQEGQ